MKHTIPGEFLAAEEEFESGANTFEENGNIFSDSVGKISEDKAQRTVSILKEKELLPLKVGSIVFGKVNLVRSSSVLVEIFAARSEKGRQVSRMTMASLPVRNVAQGYVKQLNEKFRIGDIIKAKVSMVSPYGIDLRTNEPELGVIRGYCTKCRTPLSVFGRMLKCTKCGSNETRKIASEYTG